MVGELFAVAFEAANVEMTAKSGAPMRRLVSFELRSRLSLMAFALAAVLVIGAGQVLAQSGDLRDPSKQGAVAPPSSGSTGDRQRELSEAAQAINGPAGNPECVWLGRNVVTLMLGNDLDTAFRNIDLYDRFGCPGTHIQAAFRCALRFPDLKAGQILNSQVHACWINPTAQPGTVAAAPATSPSGGAAAASAPAK